MNQQEAQRSTLLHTAVPDQTRERKTAFRGRNRHGTAALVAGLLAGTHNPRVRANVNRLFGMALLTALALPIAALAAGTLGAVGLLSGAPLAIVQQVAGHFAACAFLFFAAACLSDLALPLSGGAHRSR